MYNHAGKHLHKQYYFNISSSEDRACIQLSHLSKKAIAFFHIRFYLNATILFIRLYALTQSMNVQSMLKDSYAFLCSDICTL